MTNKFFHNGPKLRRTVAVEKLVKFGISSCHSILKFCVPCILLIFTTHNQQMHNIFDN